MITIQHRYGAWSAFALELNAKDVRELSTTELAATIRQRKAGDEFYAPVVFRGQPVKLGHELAVALKVVRGELSITGRVASLGYGIEAVRS